MSPEYHCGKRDAPQLIVANAKQSQHCACRVCPLLELDEFKDKQIKVAYKCVWLRVALNLVAIKQTTLCARTSTPLIERN